MWNETAGATLSAASAAGHKLAFNLLMLRQGTPTPGSTPDVAPSRMDDMSWLAYVWHDYINRQIPIGNFSFSLASVCEGILSLLVAYFVSRWMQGFLERRLETRTQIDPGLQYTLLRLTHYVIIAVGLMLAFRLAFGADLTSFAVLFTALSVGIGFGLQYLAGDIASGFVLLIERSVRVGDFVTVEGPDSKMTEGRVMSINMRATVVKSNDNIAVVVPNSKLVNQNLINWSYRERRSRLSVPVGVSYDSDVEHVTRTLLRATEGIEHVLDEPKASVQFIEFGASSLNFRLLVWTNRPRRHPKIKSDINYRIRKLFLDEGIAIPSPQMDVTIRQGRVATQSAAFPFDATGEEDER
ncbi:MAG: mechanosensitive ion channel domain-containing protein [Pyrinomonadaceae bacterium]